MGYFYGGTNWVPVPLSRRQTDLLECRQKHILKNSDVFLDRDSRSFLYCYQAEILLPPRLKTFSQISLPRNGHEILCSRFKLQINLLRIVYVGSVPSRFVYTPQCTIYFSLIEKVFISTHKGDFIRKKNF